jgi:ATP-binding cassette subfamily B protein
MDQPAPLFRAAAKPELAGVALASAPSPGRTVMEAHDLTLRYSDRGDWLLLEGASGGGKSKLAALMAGLRQPESGLVLAGGLDRATFGAERWRKQVAAAPQYHENHILAGTLSFNLLMGRHWPPYAKDLAEAETVCRELGLGDLLERMPAGMEQVVGKPAGSYRKANEAASSWRGPCCREATSSRSTKVSPRSIRRICANASNAFESEPKP